MGFFGHVLHHAAKVVREHNAGLRAQADARARDAHVAHHTSMANFHARHAADHARAAEILAHHKLGGAAARARAQAGEHRRMASAHAKKAGIDTPTATHSETNAKAHATAHNAAHNAAATSAGGWTP